MRHRPAGLRMADLYAAKAARDPRASELHHAIERRAGPGFAGLLCQLSRLSRAGLELAGIDVTDIGTFCGAVLLVCDSFLQPRPATS